MARFPCGARGTANASLTFRRRYWKQDGKEEWITNNIPLVFPGTKLEKVFADFLKARGGVGSGILGEYSSEQQA